MSKIERLMNTIIILKTHPGILSLFRLAKEEVRHSTQKIRKLSDGSIIFSAEVSGLIELKNGL